MRSSLYSYKSRVQHAFSKRAGHYDQYANVQAKVAEQTAGLVSKIRSTLTIPEGDVLEVGCGTGLFSAQLANIFTDRRIICSDISQKMLDTCKTRLQMHETYDKSRAVEFQIIDAEDIDEENQYAVIASSFAIQWFYEPITGLARLMKALKPGGILLFSTPGDASCPEWKAACEQLNLPFTRNPMPKFEQLLKFATHHGYEFTMHDRIIKETYDDASSMMRSMKNIGANTQRNKVQLSCVELRHLLRELDSQGKPCRTNYQVIAGTIRKPY